MPAAALTARARALEAMFSRASFLMYLGASIQFDGDLHAVVTLPHKADLEHAMGGVHGGVLATLIDAAAWCAAAVHYPRWITTIEFQTRLLEPVAAEDLVAIGRVTRVGKRIAVSEAEVRTAGGRLVATGSATLSVTNLPYE